MLQRNMGHDAVIPSRAEGHVINSFLGEMSLELGLVGLSIEQNEQAHETQE